MTPSKPKASVAGQPGKGLGVHVWGLYTLAVPVPQQMRRSDRRRRLSRQRSAAAGRSAGGGLWQMGTAQRIGIPWPRHRLVWLNYRSPRWGEGRLQGISEGRGGLTETIVRHGQERPRPPAWRGPPGAMQWLEVIGRWGACGNMIDKDKKVVINRRRTARRLGIRQGA